MKRIILYMILLLLYCSYLFAKTDVRIADIVSPPNSPKKYEGRKLKPVVTIENTGTEIINSLQIDYIVDVNNKNDSVEFIGPTTIWKGIFPSGQSIFIELKPFKHILRNGPHSIRVSINKIGSKKIMSDPVGYRLIRNLKGIGSRNRVKSAYGLTDIILRIQSFIRLAIGIDPLKDLTE